MTAYGNAREIRRAAIGVLMTLHPPTKAMRSEAASARFYEAREWNNQRFPRLQILTIAYLLAGNLISHMGKGHSHEDTGTDGGS